MLLLKRLYKRFYFCIVFSFNATQVTKCLTNHHITCHFFREKFKKSIGRLFDSLSYMIQKDIIERLIQDITRVLGKLAGLNDPKEALEYIDIAYNEYLKLDKDYLKSLTLDNIIEKLTKEKGYNIHQMELLAEIMAKEGEYLYNLERLNESADKIQKALLIFEHVAEEGQLYSIERQLTIRKIKSLLNQIQ